MKNLQIFLLLGVVILAGCTQPAGSTGGTAGLIITSFSPELLEVDSGDELLFTVIVKNVGDITVATGNAKIEIIGLDDWDGDKSISIDTDIRRADPARGEEGGEVLKDVTLKAPTKDVTVTYTPTARLSYHYSSKSTIQLKYITRELARSDPTQQSTATVTTTSGPFIVSVKGKLPIIQSGEKIKVPLQLEIQNVGGGRAFSANDLAVASDEIDRISVGASVSTQVGQALSCSPALPDTKLRLIGGKSRIISCTIEFIEVPVASIKTATFDLELEYNYLIDTQTSIDVLKPV